MQEFMDPFVAVVVDPDRTVSAGKVDIGGFCTFPGLTSLLPTRTSRSFRWLSSRTLAPTAADTTPRGVALQQLSDARLLDLP